MRVVGAYLVHPERFFCRLLIVASMDVSSRALGVLTEILRVSIEDNYELDPGYQTQARSERKGQCQVSKYSVSSDTVLAGRTCLMIKGIRQNG